jgi:hypothetical protein
MCDDLSLILTYTSIGSYEREGTFQAIGTYERRGAFTLAGTYGHTFPTILAKISADSRNFGSPLILTASTGSCMPSPVPILERSCATVSTIVV